MDTPKRPDLDGLLDYGYNLRGPKVWPTYHGSYLDRSKYVSSSEAGNCARRIKFGKMGPTPPFKNWGYAERGHLIEAWSTDLLRLGLDDVENWDLMFAGENQFSFAYGNQSGTPDGVLVNTDTNTGYVIDTKSIDPRTNWSNLPKDNHIIQVLQNCYLVDILTPYTIVGGVLWYIDASNLQKRKSFDVKMNDDEWHRLVDRATVILGADGPEDLAPEGTRMEKQCDLCDHQQECSALIAKDVLNSKDKDKLERTTKDVFK